MIEIRFEVTAKFFFFSAQPAKFLQVWLIAGAMCVTADILLNEIGSECDSNGGNDDQSIMGLNNYSQCESHCIAGESLTEKLGQEV